MKLLFVNQFYLPDVAATAQQIGDLAAWLVARGDKVTVLCSGGEYDAGSRAGERLKSRETLDDVTVRRLRTPGRGKATTAGRVLTYAGFHGRAGAWLAIHAWRFDVVVTLTTPPLIGWWSSVARWCGVPMKHVVWSMDMHPEVEAELGVWRRDGAVFRVADAMDRFRLINADAVVALGPAMTARLRAKGVAAEKIHNIGVWSGPVEASDTDVAAWRARHGLSEKFVVMYAGNAGLIHRFDGVVEAMKLLHGDARFAFAFVGGGSRQAEVIAAAEREGVSNLKVLPYVPEAERAVMLRAGDVHLVTLREGMSGVALPCKTYGALAAGRPVAYLGPGNSDTARHVREAGGGVFPGGDGAGLAGWVRALADDRAAWGAAADAARAAWRAQFSAEVGCGQWGALLDQVVR